MSSSDGRQPLLLAELLRTLRAEAVRPDAAHVDVIQQLGPRAVSRSVLHRLARLSADAVAVARAIAVLGDGAGLPETAVLAGLDEPRVAEVVRVLVGAEILSSAKPICFVHPLVRDAVYHDLASSERTLAHERAARALMDLGAVPDVVAAHLLLVPARAEQWVAELLQAAGSLAGRRGDTDSAVSYLRRALEEPAAVDKRPALLMELGMAEALLNLPEAVEHLREAGEHLDDPQHRAQCSELLVRALIFTRPPQEAVAVAQQARAELPPEYVDQDRVLEALELWAPTFGAPAAPGRGSPPGRLANGRAGRRSRGEDAHCDCRFGLGSDRGAAAQCVPLALEALSGGVLVSADPILLSGSAVSVFALAEHERTFSVLEQMAVEVRRRSSPFLLSGIYYMQGWAWLARGELAEAADVLRRSGEVALSWSSTASAYTVATFAHVLIEQGDLVGPRTSWVNEVRKCRALTRTHCARRPTSRCWSPGPGGTRRSAAVEEYAAGISPGVVNPAWVPWRSLKAQALEGLGDHDAAVRLLEEELSAARAWGAPRALSHSLRLLGSLLDEREGLDLLREAVQVAEGPRLAWNTPRHSLRSAPRYAVPASPRKRASHCGPVSRSPPAVARNRSPSMHARSCTRPVPPAGEAFSGPESLTPSEQRSRTGSRGWSNREIAQQLYVTPKTVEVHLTSTYRKLGISSRAALADALADSRPA